MTHLIDRLRARMSPEDGWVVVTAIVLMTIMLGVGLAVLATADTQSQQSRTERVRESAFEYAEGLLQAESVVLQNNWPSQAPCAGNVSTCGYAWSAADPNVCTQATAASNPNQCPSTTALAGIFTNVDQARTTVTWDIQVRDDLGVCLSNPPAGYAPFYVSSAGSPCPGPVPTYYKGICPLRGSPPPSNNAALCWPTVTSNSSADASNAPGNDKTVCTNSASASVACTWDNNGNKQLFVRVDATITTGSGSGAQTTTRSLVALLHLENFPVNLNSKDAVNGGAINFGNSSGKDIVDATGSRIVVRCYPTDNATGNPSGPLGPPSGDHQLSTTLALPAAAGTNFISVPNGTGVNFPVKKGAIAIGVGLLNAGKYEVHQIDHIVAGVAGLPDVIFFATGDNLAVGHLAGERVELGPQPVSGGSGQPGDNNCESWVGQPLPGTNASQDKHQLDPPWAYISDPNYPAFMSAATFSAVTAGLKHWVGCPTNASDWVGAVYIDSIPAGTKCTTPPNMTINSHAAPGFIFVRTTDCAATSTPALSVTGSTTYFGVIYMRNEQGCTYGQMVMQVNAGAQIDGGVTVDGTAQVQIGQAQGAGGSCLVQGGTPPNTTCPSVKFDPVEFGGITATGAAGLVQNTWRELAPGQ